MLLLVSFRSSRLPRETIGVTGVLATETGFASCTVACCNSSISESLSDTSECSALDTICKGAGFNFSFWSPLGVCGSARARASRCSFSLLLSDKDADGANRVSVADCCSFSTPTPVCALSGFGADVVWVTCVVGCSAAITFGERLRAVLRLSCWSVASALGVIEELVSDDNEYRR